MIIVMKEDIGPDSEEVATVIRMAQQNEGIKTAVHWVEGVTRSLTEIYLLGKTEFLTPEMFEDVPAVQKAIRIRDRYRTISQHGGQSEALSFDYNGVHFGQDGFQIFPGLCAVDNRENVELMFRALKSIGIQTTRAGAYKPRTSPYEFQGHGSTCLPYVFELAGKYDIRVIAMEVTHESHVEEILGALHAAGNPTGVILQIGTRNAQNFELLKFVGQQKELPVLFKRGMGITLEESLNACEYVASNGNHRIVFALRGVKTHLGDPHRNLVDFAHVSVVKRLTRLPVCVDPSHSVGRKVRGLDGLLDIHHVTAQGIIAGANMVLVDFHPDPSQAMCDGPQAMLLQELEHFVQDARLVREAYLARCALAERLASQIGWEPMRSK